MTTRTITIEDTRDDRLSAAKADLRDYFNKELADNPYMDPSDLEPHDRLFEIADGAVPIYTREIEGWHYLYGPELRQAYHDSGIGSDDTPAADDFLAVCIFCWLEAELWAYWRELVTAEADKRAEEQEE